MEKTIKGIEVIAYKGMKSNMTCRNFQYEIGETYKTDKAELCKCGFHACLNPLDVLDYYPKYKASRYFKVKLSGEITKCSMWDTNVAATEITILEEIPYDKFLTNTEWWKNEIVLDLLYYSDGFARVKNCERQYNFIDKDGKILSEQWFEWIGDFHDGLARVKRKDGKFNYIGEDGKLLSEQWFYWVGDFHDGFAMVGREDYLNNFIDKQGKILSNEWFDCVEYFKDGFATVQRTNGLQNYIDKQGKILSNDWFNWVGYFCEGFARVQRTNGEWAKIDKNGKIVSE